MRGNNRNIIDLHVHSSASDGTYRPDEIPALALKNGLSAVALTDHDTIGGIADFIGACKTQGIEGIPGIEISSSWYSGSIHIVGLFIDPSSQIMKKFLVEINANRENRNLKMLSKVNELGYDITLGDLNEESGGIILGRPHFASLLVKRGHFSTRKEVFSKLIATNQPAFVPRYLPMPDRVINIIHRAGGLAIWAHPYTFRNIQYAKMRKTARTLIKLGLDGIECNYSYFSKIEKEKANKLAEEFGLLKSGGSDFHGKNTPDVSIGLGMGDLEIPYKFLEKMKEKQSQKLCNV